MVLQRSRAVLVLPQPFGPTMFMAPNASVFLSIKESMIPGYIVHVYILD